MTQCQALPAVGSTRKLEWQRALFMGGFWLVGCLLASPLWVWVNLINPMEKDSGLVSLGGQVWGQRMVEVKRF